MQFTNDLWLILTGTKRSANRFIFKACGCGSEDLYVRWSNITTAPSVEGWVHSLILAGAWTCFSSYHLVLILRIMLLNVFKVAPSGPLVVSDFDAFKAGTCNVLLLWLIEVVFLGVSAGSNWVLCCLSGLDKRTGPRCTRSVPVYRSFGGLFDMIVHDLVGAWSDSARIIH